MQIQTFYSSLCSTEIRDLTSNSQKTQNGNGCFRGENRTELSKAGKARRSFHKMGRGAPKFALFLASTVVAPLPLHLSSLPPGSCQFLRSGSVGSPGSGEP